MEYLTTTEAMEYLKIGHTSLYDHVRKGNLKAYRVPNKKQGQYRFTQEDLDNFLKGVTNVAIES